MDNEFKENDSVTRKQFRIYKTILEIMEARNYVVSNEAKDLTLPEFLESYENGTLKANEIFSPLEEDELSEVEHSIVVVYNWNREKIT